MCHLVDQTLIPGWHPTNKPSTRRETYQQALFVKVLASRMAVEKRSQQELLPENVISGSISSAFKCFKDVGKKKKGVKNRRKNDIMTLCFFRVEETGHVLIRSI